MPRYDGDGTFTGYDKPDGFDQSAWNWLNAAAGVNGDQAGWTLASATIRGYTSAELTIRYGSVPNIAGITQQASNAIAVALVATIVGNGGVIPSIGQLGTIDAGAGIIQTLRDLHIDPGADYTVWSGTVLFPYLGVSNYYTDWLLNARPFSALDPDGVRRQYTNQYGAYDLVASVEAQRAALDAAVRVAPLHPVDSFLTLIGAPPGATATDQSALVNETDAWFDGYYGLAPDGEFQPGHDLFFSSGTQSNDLYVVGTLAGETLDERQETRNAYAVMTGEIGSMVAYKPTVVVGGGHDDTIYATTEGDDLVDGGLGDNTLHAGGGNDVLFGGGTGSNTLYGTPTLRPAKGRDAPPRTKDVLVGGGGDAAAAAAAIGVPADATGPTADGPAPSDGDDTFHAGAGNNLMIGGNGRNVFKIENAKYDTGLNVIWGGGGQSVYEFTGGETVYLVRMDDPSAAKLRSLDFDRLIAAYHAARADDGSGGQVAVIIDPTPGDRVSLDGYYATAVAGPDGGGFVATSGLGYLPDSAHVLDLTPPESFRNHDGESNYDTVSIHGFYDGDLGVSTAGFTGNPYADQAAIDSYRDATPRPSLQAASGAQPLVAGPGDVLLGTGGGTAYEVGAGDGDVTVGNDAGTAANGAVLAFDVVIAPADVAVSADGADLVLADEAAGTRVTLRNALAGAARSVPDIRFADGTDWTAAGLDARFQTGSAANTRLYGDYGANTLDPAGHAHYARGNGGDDTFVYARGYGDLEVAEQGAGASPDGTLAFGAGIAAADLRVAGDYSGALLLTDTATGARIRVDDMLTKAGAGVARFRFADGTGLTAAQMLARAMQPGAANTALFGTAGADVLDGQGIATFEEGNGGGDTFLYNSGYGALTIDDTATPGAANVLRFGAGIAPAAIAVAADGGDLVLTDGVAGDAVDIQDMLDVPGDGIQRVDFADGGTLTAAQLVAMLPSTEPVPTVLGTTGAETLTGTAGADVIDGLGGGPGSGPGGGDTLVGGGGGDTFLYDRGYGALTVAAPGDGVADTLRLGPGIALSDIGFADGGAGDAVLTDGTAGDRVVLRGALDGNGVRTLSFDGAAVPVAALPNGENGPCFQDDGLVLVADDADAELYGEDDTVLLGLNESLAVTGDGNFVRGGADVNLVTVTGNGNTVDGGSGGANLLATGTGNTLLAGTDFARVQANGNGNTLQAGAGAGTLTANGDDNVLLGGSGYAAFVATGDGNRFTGSGDAAGNNAVAVTGNHNVLTGAAAGVDFLAVGDGNRLTAGSAFNRVEARGSNNLLRGGDGAATLIASSGTDNLLVAGGGYTELDAAGTGNTLLGGSGTNTFTVTGDSNTLSAGTAYAELHATGDGNVLTGGGGSNTLSANGGNNTLVAGGGYGLLTATGDGNTLRGGSGNATLVASGSHNAIRAGSVYERAEIDGDGNTFTGGAGNGDLTVNGDGNQITGGQAYWAAVIAGTGNTVNAGDNTIRVTATQLGNGYASGDGYLILDYAYLPGAVTVNLATGSASAAGVAATDTLAGVSEVSVGYNSNAVAGADAASLTAIGNGTTLTGGAGDDTLTASGNYDTLTGGGGANTLVGAGGHETYRFGADDEQDSILNGAAGATSPSNRLQFLDGITEQDLWFARSGDDLDLTVIGTDHTIDVRDWFAGAGSRLSSLQDAGGMTLDAGVPDLVSAMAGYQAAHPGFSPGAASAIPGDPSVQNAIAAAWHS